MFCSRCGRSLPEAASFCPNCGAPTATASATAPPAGPPIPSAEAPRPEAPLGTPAPAGPAVAAPRYAGFWIRVVAFIIDGLIVGAVMTPFGLGLGLAHLGSALGGDMSPEMMAALIMASLTVWFVRVIVSWLYGAGFESSRWQATPGKMLLGLKVTDLEGRRITFVRATGRALGKWVSGILLGMGYVLVAFTDRKQGLHDFMAGTLVRR